MSAPDLTQFPALPRDAGGPLFRAPWEAQAFALAVALHERGLFRWREFTERLAEALAAARARGEPDDGSRYYEHWLAALERLAAERGWVTGPELARRRDEWDRAARDTPHGRPVELRRR